MDLGDLEPHRLENIRRSLAMLTPGQPGLDRDAAIRIVEELQRLQSSDTRHRGFVNQLRV